MKEKELVQDILNEYESMNVLGFTYYKENEPIKDLDINLLTQELHKHHLDITTENKVPTVEHSQYSKDTYFIYRKKDKSKIF